jgi:hypothetical protein
MTRYVLVATVAALVILSGIVQGLWTDRWGAATEVSDAVARLDDVPRTLGDWSGTDLVLSREEIDAARIAGYCYRLYENSRNRHAVQMLLVTGRPGPIAVHTPDVCFEGAGYGKVGPPTALALRYGAADDEAHLRTIRMRETEAAFPSEVRIFWTWLSAGSWQAPDNPRLTFSRRRALYKLYVLRARASGDVRPEDDPCAQFLKVLLPELDTALGNGS